jgi:uncharacterized protein YbcV (DUF1398 family)
MFTISQIRETHSKVKSGADFPNYVQEMKTLGVKRYEHYVSNGHILYYGSNSFTLSAEPKWQPMELAAHADTEALKHALTIHQAGQTDYLTFCRQSAAAGVEKWVVDMENMACTYYDIAGNEMVVETIPTP